VEYFDQFYHVMILFDQYLDQKQKFSVTQLWALVLLQMGLATESIDIEYRVSDNKFQKSIGVSLSNTSIEVSEYRISNTEKSIECPALVLELRYRYFLGTR
jgi:hypothetical protein